jgi:cytochrome c-type biogenesis protein CcmH
MVDGRHAAVGLLICAGAYALACGVPHGGGTVASVPAAPPAASTGAAAALNGIPGPSREQMAAASQLPSGQQEAMVRGMVDGLAAKLQADPKQPDRWMMLIRSRMMLGQDREAAQALQQAIAANPESRADLVQAARTLGVPGA